MSIIILVAYDDKRVIGDHGKIPWHSSEDMKLFKQKTTGHPVLMGRKTYESLPVKPLPGRLNVVLTRDLSKIGSPMGENGPYYVADLLPFINLTRSRGEDLYIIGGADVYTLALKLGVVDKIIVSKMQGSYPGDTYFPILSEERWICTVSEQHKGFEVLEYTKKGK